MIRDIVARSPGFDVVEPIWHSPLRRVGEYLVDRSKRDYVVPLTEVQARFLANRAKSIGSTPDAILGEILTLVMQGAPTDSAPLDDQSVWTAFREYADRYRAISQHLLERDPDLCIGAHSDPAEDATQLARATSADEAAMSSSAPGLSDAELQQAFSEFANEYPAVCEQVFGQQAALSAQLDNRPIRAWAVPIPQEARIGDEAAPFAELLDRFTPSARGEPAPSTYIVHLLVDTEEPLEGPAIIYPSPSHELSQRTTEA